MTGNWLGWVAPQYPGFQVWRTTANAILPVRTAAEYCVATQTEMAVLLDDLKWCFDQRRQTTPPAEV